MAQTATPDGEQSGTPPPQDGPPPAFPQWLLITGFFAGLLLAFVLIVVVFVNLAHILSPLLQPLGEKDEVKEPVMYANLMRMKMCLLIGGVTTGIALMFLGLPLFLVGFNNTMVVDSEKFGKILGATPGVLAILGGVVLVGFCCSQQFRVDRGTDGVAASPPPGKDDKPGGGGSPAARNFASYLFSAEESKMLEQLKRDMSQDKASGAEFSRTAQYLSTLYKGLASDIPDQPGVSAEQKQAKAEYLRIADAFTEMRLSLIKNETPSNVATQFITKNDKDVYVIKDPKKP